jgi:valyl-tRNA synthetase
VLRTFIALLAPIMPFVTEEVYQLVFKKENDARSIHVSAWPEADIVFVDDDAEAAGNMLIEVATAVRRYKSEKKVPMGSALETLKIAAAKESYADVLRSCLVDIKSVTRAKQIDISVAKLETPVTVQEIS